MEGLLEQAQVGCAHLLGLESREHEQFLFAFYFCDACFALQGP